MRLKTEFTEVFRVEHPIAWAAFGGSVGRNLRRPWWRACPEGGSSTRGSTHPGAAVAPL